MLKPTYVVTTGDGPTVTKVAPCATHVMMQTTQSEMWKIAVDEGITGGVGVSFDAKVSADKSVEKTTTYAAEITGKIRLMTGETTSLPDGP